MARAAAYPAAAPLAAPAPKQAREPGLEPLFEVAANHGDISPFVTERTNAAVRAKIGY